MPDRVVPPHWLRRNEGTRSPHRVCFIDSESRPELTVAGEEHSLRWWHARLARRHTERPRFPVTLDLAGTAQADLAAAVDSMAIAKHSLWVYTHNLGFDLQVTRLPEMLARLGWEIADIGITGRSPWVRMRNGRRLIILADSTSWLPAPLAEIGTFVGVDKPVITDWTSATDEEIAVRCLADVEILARAMLEIMDWWDAGDMGRWQWTGPGCGWAVFRHKFLTAKVLMDPDPVRLELERKAIYGGRREAYRIGDLGPGQYADLDFEAAYPQIASVTELPRRPIARVPYMTPEAYGSLPPDWGILSEATVTTSTPVVPCRTGGRVYYPVGTFTTVLAGPDIAGAVEAGATVALGDTIIYQLEPFLADWGKWITGVLDGSGEAVPAVVRTMAKHWSRTVIGRFAMHAQRTEDWGDACWPYFKAEPGLDWDTGLEVVDLHACGRHLRVFRDAEPDNVFPAVTAWVEATCRQLLRKAMEACPAGSVMQCDTDGFMLDARGYGASGTAAVQSDPAGEAGDVPAAVLAPPVPELVGPVTVRVKGLYDHAEIMGPQQVILGPDRRISGVPRSFTTPDGRTYSGWTWPGYSWQLARSQPGIYTRPHVTVPLRGPYGSRWIMSDGRTMPPEMMVINGHNIIRKPWRKGTELERSQFADMQPAALAKAAA
jgi:hypothetical protein